MPQGSARIKTPPTMVFEGGGGMHTPLNLSVGGGQSSRPAWFQDSQDTRNLNFLEYLTNVPAS